MVFLGISLGCIYQRQEDIIRFRCKLPCSDVICLSVLSSVDRIPQKIADEFRYFFSDGVCVSDNTTKPRKCNLC